MTTTLNDARKQPANPANAVLAVSGITATALSMFHMLDATVVVLMWNLGTVLLFVGLGSLFSHRFFRWVAPVAYTVRG